MTKLQRHERQRCNPAARLDLLWSWLKLRYVAYSLLLVPPSVSPLQLVRGSVNPWDVFRPAAPYASIVFSPLSVSEEPKISGDV